MAHDLDAVEWGMIHGIMDSDQTVSFPHRESGAALMLTEALRRKHDEGIGLRQVAQQLKYKQAVVLSHMATGRVPIPVDRALCLAEVLGLDPKLFLAAVLKQRFPSIPWKDYGLLESASPSGAEAVSVDQLTEQQKVILREMLRDRDPEERWLTIAEVSAVNMLRALRPHMRSQGLSAADIQAIRDGLEFGPF
ncbi:MAG: hypothetical protein IIZ38_18765 [Sphingomonas sp.]|uniref:hypothetical protein n=1 Tax=Sphingomonas sp. TaxID=28214 RepID=UPI0025D9FA0B|nr:hypothetical protein [Sphingomonas sp.]MBQ1500355.1 hypothetical protein [Sphingomonas sp.]MBQ8104245.1 hypothetical protein [Afipia sp.]